MTNAITVPDFIKEYLALHPWLSTSYHPNPLGLKGPTMSNGERMSAFNRMLLSNQTYASTGNPVFSTAANFLKATGGVPKEQDRCFILINSESGLKLAHVYHSPDMEPENKSNTCSGDIDIKEIVEKVAADHGLAVTFNSCLLSTHHDPAYT
jgi:hypothetical protein